MIVLAAAAGFITPLNTSQAQTPRFMTGTELEAEEKAAEPVFVGRRIWFQPEPGTIVRKGFCRSLAHEDRAMRARLYPGEILPMTVMEKIPRSEATGFSEFYKVRFDDGSVAFIEAGDIEIGFSWLTPDAISPANLEDARFEAILSSESFYLVNPSTLQARIRALDQIAANKRKAAAAHSRQAEAERKARGGVAVGMTAVQVRGSSWGKPEVVNKTIATGIEREQWVYPGYNYLYFENGILTTIQTSKE